MILQLFNRYLEPGGEEVFVDWVTEHLRESHELENLVWETRDWDRADKVNRVNQVCRLFYNRHTARELRGLIAEKNPEALLCHNLYPVGSPSVYHVAQKTGTPVIQYLHNYRPFSVGGALWSKNQIDSSGLSGNYLPEIGSGAWQNSMIKSAVFATMLKMLHTTGWLESVSCWVAISDFVRSKFLEAGLPPERVVTLRHGWQMDSILEEKPEENYYLFLSRLVREKGVGVLLKAWESLEKELGSSCPRLLIAGLGPEANAVTRAAENSSRVQYVGFVNGEHKADLIARSRALMAPSVWWEPAGLVTYEAYNAGKPMMASSSGGLKETVFDGKTGFVHDPGDVDSLVQSVLRMERATLEERKMMGQSGRQWLRENADPGEWRRGFQEVLDLAVSHR